VSISLKLLKKFSLDFNMCPSRMERSETHNAPAKYALFRQTQTAAPFFRLTYAGYEYLIRFNKFNKRNKRFAYMGYFLYFDRYKRSPAPEVWS
jgi:hypothetical protein